MLQETTFFLNPNGAIQDRQWDMWPRCWNGQIRMNHLPLFLRIISLVMRNFSSNAFVLGKKLSVRQVPLWTSVSSRPFRARCLGTRKSDRAWENAEAWKSMPLRDTRKNLHLRRHKRILRMAPTCGMRIITCGRRGVSLKHLRPMRRKPLEFCDASKQLSQPRMPKPLERSIGKFQKFLLITRLQKNWILPRFVSSRGRSGGATSGLGTRFMTGSHLLPELMLRKDIPFF